MQTVDINIDELRPYEKNAKIHSPKQIEQIAASLLEFGWRQPLVVTADKVVVVGHGRLAGAKIARKTDPAFSHAPCLIADDLSDEQIKAYRLADNKLNESPWDPQLTEEELASFTEIDMSAFGFDLSELAKKTASVVEDDYNEELPRKTKSKLGDIYQLGKHRLICGDSTDPAVIDRLMDGVKAKLLLTDPPYGIDVVKGNKVGGDKAFGKVDGGGQTKFGKVGGENIVKSKTYSAIIGDDTTDTARASYDVAITYTENQIIFGGNYFTDFLKPSRCWVVWDKQNTGNFADAELAWTSFDKGVKLYHFLWNGLCREGSREVEGKTRVHPTQKPVGMLADILKDFSEDNDTVLDLFGGSGSTLIACEQLNRKCYMCELDPRYVDVIINRWEQFTGQKAVKLN